ncbi:hypothetical protein H0H93_016862 [Arthromyces matolae]|nr:hypothetical protein H0H93_016862 [Arthromyces matolae]
MSLTNALHTLDAVPNNLPDNSIIASPDSCYSSLPSLSHSSPSSSSSSIHSESTPDTERTPNEHLAVLLPRHLWKTDSATTKCDSFYCRVSFSFIDRRHHCRKCGGVFCATCTRRSTPLLDTSNLAFLNPPRNIPLASYASPISPLRPHRVCDDCWNQIHGTRSASTPCSPQDIVPSSLNPILTSSPAASSTSSLSSIVDEHMSKSDSLLTTVVPIARTKTRSLRTIPSSSSLNGSRRTVIRASHLTLPPDLERSYGELDAYPLRRSSVICKATGGGRWEPKQDPPVIGYRLPIPGAKAQYEIDMEEEDRAVRARRENPVIKDGEFQYRFFREHAPLVLSCTPNCLSTF